MNAETIPKAISDTVHYGKVVATLGPVSESEEKIALLFDAGADVFRLNFSHGSHEEQGARIQRIRALEKQTGKPIGIIADLQGPKLRIGTFSDEGGVLLKSRDTFMFRLDEVVGTEKEVTLPHPEIFKSAEVGMDILIDDGRLRFRVEAVSEGVLETKVITGGTIKQRKGVNIPKVQLPIAAVTEKDEKDLQFAVSQGVDWIALSFVQRPDDVLQAKKLIEGKAGIIAKIEKPSALECLEDIIAEVDGIMVARGDLGVEVPPEEVPGAQKKMIALCRQAGKPIIVATHMLDSMVSSPYPTRAEVSDVATAMYDGTDAVMLSAETAAGEYPVESVAMMRRIVRRTAICPEFFDVVYRLNLQSSHCAHDQSPVDALCSRANEKGAAAVMVRLSGSEGLEKIACYARQRHNLPLFVVTDNERVARQMTLFWGVISVLMAERDGDPMQKIREMGFMSEKDIVYTG